MHDAVSRVFDNDTTLAVHFGHLRAAMAVAVYRLIVLHLVANLYPANSPIANQPTTHKRTTQDVTVLIVTHITNQSVCVISS